MENNLNNLLDLNQSSPKALQTLPGIGPVLAERIIAARPFSSVEDLRHVEGINEFTLEQLRPLVTVFPPGEATVEEPSLSEQASSAGMSPSSAGDEESQPAAAQEPADLSSEAVPGGEEEVEMAGEYTPEAAPEGAIAEAAGDPALETQLEGEEFAQTAGEAAQEEALTEEAPAQPSDEAISEEPLPELEAEAEIMPEAEITAEAEIMPEAEVMLEVEAIPEVEAAPEEETLPEGVAETEPLEEEPQEEGAPAYFDAAQELPPIGSVSQEGPREAEPRQPAERPKPASPVRQPRYVTRGEAFWIAAGGAVVSAVLAAAFVLLVFFALNGSLHYARLSDQNRLRAQITGMQSDVSALQSGLAEVQTGLQALQGLSDRVGTLEGDAAQAQADLNTLQSQFNDLDGKLGDLTKQVDDLGTQAAAINQQLDTLSGNVVDLQNLTQRFQNFFDGLRNLLDVMSQP